MNWVIVVLAGLLMGWVIGTLANDLADGMRR